MTLKMLVGSVLVAGALVAGGGAASAAAPAATASTATTASVAAAGCSKNPGLGQVYSDRYQYWIINASATGGCADRPSTVTVLLIHNGVEVGRGVCQAAAGRTCFAATRSVRWLGGDWQAR